MAKIHGGQIIARSLKKEGVDAVFMEVHRDPDNALSDGPNSLPLDELGTLLDSLLTIQHALGNGTAA